MQFVFYDGKWPEGSELRYHFPGVLAGHLALLFGLGAFVHLIRTSLIGSGWIIAVPLIASFCFLAAASGDFRQNRVRSMAVVQSTSYFMAKLDIAIDYLRKYPSSTLVLNSHSVQDYEPIFSLVRFVRAAGIMNAIALDLDGYSSKTFPDGSLAFDLSMGLEDHGYLKEHDLVPFSSVNVKQGRCFSLGLSGPPLRICTEGVTIWP